MSLLKLVDSVDAYYVLQNYFNQIKKPQTLLIRGICHVLFKVSTEGELEI